MLQYSIFKSLEIIYENDRKRLGFESTTSFQLPLRNPGFKQLKLYQLQRMHHNPPNVQTNLSQLFDSPATVKICLNDMTWVARVTSDSLKSQHSLSCPVPGVPGIK